MDTTPCITTTTSTTCTVVMAEREEQRAEFYRLLEDYINSLGKSKRNCYCITQQVYNKALQALQLAKGVKCPEGSKFKFWASKHFNFQEIGARKILYCNKTLCPVVPKEEIFDRIKCCHSRVGHSSRDKTWEEIRTNYSWIRYNLVQLYLRTCRECSARVALKTTSATEIWAEQGTQPEDDIPDFSSITREVEQAEQLTPPSPNKTLDNSTQDPEPTCSQQSMAQEFTPVQIKQERDQHLLYEERITADGTDFLDQESVHGKTYDQLHQMEPLRSTDPDFGRNWMREETRTLISFWAQPSIQAELEGTYRNRYVYDTISRQMCQAGWQRTWKQCQCKVKDLKLRYRKATNLYASGKNGSSVCPFYKQLHAVLRNQPSKTQRAYDFLPAGTPDSIHPVHVVDNTQVNQAIDSATGILPDGVDHSIASPPTQVREAETVPFAHEELNRDERTESFARGIQRKASTLDSFSEPEEEPEEVDEADSDSVICGLSKDVTLAVLPRLQLEELLLELRRRNVDVMAGSNNKKSLVKVLHRMMVGEYAVEELKSITMVTTNTPSDKQRGSSSKTSYSASESRSGKEGSTTKPIVWVVQPGSSGNRKLTVAERDGDNHGDTTGAQGPNRTAPPAQTVSTSTLKRTPEESQATNQQSHAEKTANDSAETDAALPSASDRLKEIVDQVTRDLEGSGSDAVMESGSGGAPDHDSSGAPEQDHLNRQIKQEPQDAEMHEESREEDYRTQDYTDDHQFNSGDNMNWEFDSMAEEYHEGESTAEGRAEQGASWYTGGGEDRSGTAQKLASSAGGGMATARRAGVVLATHTGPPKFVMTRAALKNPQLFQRVSRAKGKRTGIKRKCPYCPYTAERNRLLPHVRTHTGEKPFRCSMCNYSACQKQNLNRHMKIHTGEKPFMCGECGYRTAYKCHLVPHMLEHAGSKPFVCGECGYRSARKSNMRYHQKTHQKSRPFKCRSSNQSSGASQPASQELQGQDDHSQASGPTAAVSHTTSADQHSPAASTNLQECPSSSSMQQVQNVPQEGSTAVQHQRDCSDEISQPIKSNEDDTET